MVGDLTRNRFACAASARRAGVAGLLLAALFWSSVAFAGMGGGAGGASGGAGSGGGGGGGGGAGAKTGGDLTTCEWGKVWDAKNHACVTKPSGVRPDSELIE
jgi:hypothetical protein